MTTLILHDPPFLLSFPQTFQCFTNTGLFWAFTLNFFPLVHFMLAAPPPQIVISSRSLPEAHLFRKAFFSWYPYLNGSPSHPSPPFPPAAPLFFLLILLLFSLEHILATATISYTINHFLFIPPPHVASKFPRARELCGWLICICSFYRSDAWHIQGLQYLWNYNKVISKRDY